MSIKARILGILAALAGGYLLLLLAGLVTSTATHNRMSQISTSLFPAVLRMQEAEAAFERMKKHFGDAVVLQDADALAGAEKEAKTTAAALSELKILLAASPELGKKADTLLTQFSSLRLREHNTYAALFSAKDGSSDDLMAQVGALGKDNKSLTEAMAGLDKAIAANFQTQLDTTMPGPCAAGLSD